MKFSDIVLTQRKTNRAMISLLSLMFVLSVAAPVQAQSAESPLSPSTQLEVSEDRVSDKPVSMASKKLLIAKKPATVASTITWQNNLNKTYELAKTNRKWILVDVYTDWCHWCKRLDSDVYAQPAVAKFINSSFVCLKANAERGDGMTVKSKYGVSGYPCTLILEPGGKEKGRIDGYLPPGKFTAEITNILNR
jgi:thiol:disulfide interchange protein